MGKKTPGLNTGSMADISFLLLTFFLLTSSINTDQGIQRRLPPPLKGDEKPPKVNERNVLKILVNMYDQLLVNNEPMNNVNELKARAKEFISNPTNNPHMAIVKLKYIEELGREAPVSDGIVSLQSDRGTSYKMYIAVQNQLAAAFDELRNEYSHQNYGKSFDNLSEEQRKGVQKVVPISISEAEPSNYGGKK
ncbi:MAG: biopolymer transporter ExbD [Bacteroidales bacterium]|jgi:biopolymer transport protein ExbD|nr:biopolymer transporter ExbD [Bacteroidales bacterium]